jgi:hypothetical protein
MTNLTGEGRSSRLQACPALPELITDRAGRQAAYRVYFLLLKRRRRPIDVYVRGIGMII